MRLLDDRRIASRAPTGLVNPWD